jgi:hypothetical protein
VSRQAQRATEAVRKPRKAVRRERVVIGELSERVDTHPGAEYEEL